MKYRLTCLSFCTILPLLLLAALFGVVQAANDPVALRADVVSTALWQRRVDAAPNEPIRYIIYFKSEPNLLAARSLSTAARRRVVVQQLREAAAADQRGALMQLDALQRQGKVSSYRQLWIVNAISVVGTSRTIDQLAANPAVDRIDLDRLHEPLPSTAVTDTIDTFFIESFVQNSVVLTAPLKNWGLNQIRAPHVWHGLGVDGAGVTIAVIDTGVDFQHPDLVESYRGNLGGSFDHTASWYNAVISTSLVPTDTIGHGTHVAGIAVGQNGIGVAPRAEWIAVNVFTKFGGLFTSDGLAGMQWLLAPNGDPSLAPDIVNGSWGNSLNTLDFHDGIKALDAAGIIPIFAIGNAGPKAETVASPGSYTETVAVGASDELNKIAWFSSRGPSSHVDEARPYLLAPGTAIYSTFPGELYAIQSGTSMATPHVSGLTALLLSADDSLDKARLKQALAQTAVPISETHPNNASGWGIVDAYAAVAQHTPHGTLRGVIRGSDGVLANLPFMLTTPSGAHLPIVTDDAGQYSLPLLPGNYAIRIEKFGYVPFEKASVTVNLNQTTTQHITLAALPATLVSGTIIDGEKGHTVYNVRVSVAGREDVAVVADQDGRYQIALPEGLHKLVFAKTGYGIERRTVFSLPPDSMTLDVTLAPIPRVLLVDAGDWVFASVAPFYKDALDGLDISFDTHAIRDPFANKPTLAQLSNYDTVIWSDPYFSPGTISASPVITHFLASGGNMLISGQNVGARDGVGFVDLWWLDNLRAQYLGKEFVTVPLTANPETPFANMLVPIGGGNSANNQGLLDAAEPRDGTLGEPLLYYANGQPAAMGVGQCEPYRLVYFGFGVEGVSFSVVRSALLSRTFDYFEAPDDLVGLRWLNEDVSDFAVPGKTYSYTVSLQNLSESYTDTVALSLDKGRWPMSVVTPTVTLGPCQSAQTIVTLTVPDAEPDDSYHQVQLTAASSLNPAQKKALRFDHKTPGDILLLDDDRWYDQEAKYRLSLNRMNLTYDVWDTNWKKTKDNSPPPDLLAAYDYIIWYTGYDWFQPVTPREREGLERFLAQGGRLFLSSQDFMYYHAGSVLARDYFGVLDFRESISPTAMFGSAVPGYSANLAGPLPLTYGPYLNFSDGLLPAADSEVLFWHSSGMPAAVGHEGEAHRAVLMAVPFETLPEATHDEVMNQMVGWISDLGGSSIVVDDRHLTPGEPRTYTVTIRNSPIALTNAITMTNALPNGLTLRPGSLTGGATYDAGSRTVTWRGTLPPGSIRQVVYQALPQSGLVAGTAVENKATFAYSSDPIVFDSYATSWVDAPDLHTSRVTMATDQPAAPTQLTFTLWLTNSGLFATGGVSAVLYMPHRVFPLTESMRTGGGTAVYTNKQLVWQGDLAPGQSVTTTMAFTRTPSAVPQPIQTIFSLYDGVTAGMMHRIDLLIDPFRRFFPLAGNG